MKQNIDLDKDIADYINAILAKYKEKNFDNLTEQLEDVIDN